MFMLDKDTETKRTHELAALTKTGFYKVRDVDGHEHIMRLIDMQDLADLRSKFGVADIDQDDPALYQFLLWLSIRKGSCSEEQLDRGEYAMTLSKAGRMFTMVEVQAASKDLQELLYASGLHTQERAVPEGLDPNVPWTAEYVGGRRNGQGSGQPSS